MDQAGKPTGCRVPIPGHPPSSSASPPLPLPHCHHQTHRVPHPLAHPVCPPADQSSSPSARSCASAPVGSGIQRCGPWGAGLPSPPYDTALSLLPGGRWWETAEPPPHPALPLTSGDGSWVGTRPSVVAVRSCSPRMSFSCWASTSCCSMLQWFSRDRITGNSEAWGAMSASVPPDAGVRRSVGGQGNSSDLCGAARDSTAQLHGYSTALVKWAQLPALRCMLNTIKELTMSLDPHETFTHPPPPPQCP